MNEFAEKEFSNQTATLVALLVLNDRKSEAEKIGAAAAKEWSDPELAKLLKAALNGNLPEPWP